MTPIATSATDLRTIAGEGASIRYLTPDPVVEYIRSHGLYSSRSRQPRATDIAR